MYPQLRIDLQKINENLNCLCDLAKKNGCSTMIVTKGICADKRIVGEVLKNENVNYLADSRIKNIAGYCQKAHAAGKETVLLRLPMLNEIANVVRYADISLNSEIETIKHLNEEAERLNIVHKIILVIDEGDSREGVLCTDIVGIFEMVEKILPMKNIKLEGIGTNFSGFNGMVPGAENLENLCEIAEKIEEKFNIKLNIISGGSTSSVYMLMNGKLPQRINSIRLGEAFILGHDSANDAQIPGTNNYAVTLRAQVIELKKKPEKFSGDFKAEIIEEDETDEGHVMRAILALGIQDTDPAGLTPINTEAVIKGATADHMVMNTEGHHYHVGDTVDFTMTYNSLVRLFISPYVDRVYL